MRDAEMVLCTAQRDADDGCLAAYGEPGGRGDGGRGGIGSGACNGGRGGMRDRG